jgi:hypothetical protein
VKELSEAVKHLRVTALSRIAARMGYAHNVVEIARDVEQLPDSVVIARLRANHERHSWLTRFLRW